MDAPKPILSAPLADLLRVTPFKGDNDVRRYLSGVLVTPFEDHALLVATNGHWMAIYESAEARTDKDRILDLPGWFVNQLKALQDPRAWDEDGELEESPDAMAPVPTSPTQTLTVEREGSRLTIGDPTELLVKPGEPFIEGNFPNWRKVLPDPDSLVRGLSAPFAVHYLSRLHEVLPGEVQRGLFCYQHRERAHDTCAVFRFDGMPQLVLALMPMRDTLPPEWPPWMPRKSEEAAS